jgi:hypothetical protein
VIDFLERRAGKSCNISHGPPGEAKEILKEFGDDCFGNDEARMTNVEGMTKIRGDLLRERSHAGALAVLK